MSRRRLGAEIAVFAIYRADRAERSPKGVGLRTFPSSEAHWTGLSKSAFSGQCPGVSVHQSHYWPIKSAGNRLRFQFVMEVFTPNRTKSSCQELDGPILRGCSMGELWERGSRVQRFRVQRSRVLGLTVQGSEVRGFRIDDC
jgi:hypothetical protein